MFKKLLTTTCIIASLATATVCVAAPAPQEGGAPGATVEQGAGSQSSLAIIEQIMSVSGMNEMIEQLPASVAMGFDQQPPPPVNRGEYEKFRTAYLQTFEPARVRAAIVSHLDRHYEPERYAELLALLKTPLAQQMKLLEVEAGRPEAQQEMMQMANIIMGQASPARLALAQQLDEAQKAAQSMIDVQLMMARAMMEGMNRLAPPEQKITAEQQAQMLEQMRAQSLYPARQFVHLGMVYTYRTVSDEVLGDYLKLHQSEAGQWGTELLRNAWMALSEDVSLRLAELMQASYIKNNAL
jgi:hypothetical protein